MTVRHFLTLLDLTAAELNALIDRAIELKRLLRAGEDYRPMTGKTLAMIFDKSSTRTRVSFEAGMAQFGGQSIFLSPENMQLGRGEPTQDTARVISSMVDVVVIRTSGHDMVEAFSSHSQVPVINGLTDLYHPCQLLADIQTFVEQRGSITGARVAWIGDGNNMCHSWINAARQFDFDLAIATPEEYRPDARILKAADGHATLAASPAAAAQAADVVVTDTWASMGQEDEKTLRQQAFADFCVNQSLMNLAAPDALFMHCLPAYRDQEVSTEVLEGKQSVVWQEAENRMHAQKALIEYLVMGDG